MKLDYDAVLTTPKGEPVEGVTLGGLLYDVLLANEQELTGDKKLKHARIAKKVVEKEDLTVEELAIAKERALKYASAAVVLSIESHFESR